MVPENRIKPKGETVNNSSRKWIKKLSQTAKPESVITMKRTKKAKIRFNLDQG